MRAGRAFRVATLEEVAHYGKTLPRGLRAPIAGGAGVVLDHALTAYATAPPSGGYYDAQSVSATVPIGDLLVIYGFWVPTGSGNSQVVYDNVALVGSYTTYNSSNVAVGGRVLTAGVTTANYLVILNSPSSQNGTVGGEGGASFSGVHAASATGMYAQASAAFTGASPTIATGAPVRTGDLVVAVSMVLATSGVSAMTQPTGWSALSAQNVLSSGTHYTLQAAYLVAPSDGVITYAPTSAPAGLAGSRAVIVAFPATPVNTVAPAVTGTTKVGQTLSSTTGTWTG